MPVVTSVSHATRPARIHAHGDVRGLAVDRLEYGAGLRVEPEVGVGIADRLDGAAHDVGNVHVGGRGDFSRHDRHARGHQRFAGDAGFGIGSQNRIEDRVGDLVRDLVRMSFGN